MSSSVEDQKEAKENTDTKSSGIDLDRILIEEIGQFGKFQLRTAILLWISGIFVALAATEYLFTTARIRTRCLIPECEERGKTVYAPEWILNAVPGTSIDTFDNCQRFITTGNSTTINDTSCPAHFFDDSDVKECQEYVYENTETVVYDYDLACDEWRRALIGSVRIVGLMVGLPINGYISDRWGRRRALTINATFVACLGIIRYWANTYNGFVVSQVIEAFVSSGIYSSAYILLLELAGPKYRIAAGATMNTAVSLGQALMGLIAWIVPNWRNLTLTLYVPQLLVISYFWILPDSIRWQLSKGHYSEAEAWLRKAAKVNGKELSDKSLVAIRESVEQEKGMKIIEEQKRSNEPLLVIQVFKNTPILIRCIVGPIWWITVVLIYYGMSVNAVNLSGNKYLNFAAVSTAEVPGYWINVLLLGRIGRKPVLVGAFWIGAACQIAFVFISDDLFGLSLTMYLIGTTSIATAVNATYIYTAELFPTKYRHNLFAFCSALGRIGSIIAPLTPAIGAATFYELPFLIFAGLSVLSGLLIFVTPETLGCKLPDTMEDACNIGTDKNKS